MTGVLLVAAGGAIGAVLRYGVGLLVVRRAGTPALFGTLFVNITGAFALGLLYGLGWQLERKDALLFAGTGVIGGYTTFSTLKVQLSAMAGRRAFGSLGLYAGITYLAGIGLAVAGYAAGRLIRAS